MKTRNKLMILAIICLIAGRLLVSTSVQAELEERL